jgi:hypothetical protein
MRDIPDTDVMNINEVISHNMAELRKCVDDIDDPDRKLFWTGYHIPGLSHRFGIHIILPH